MGNVICEMTPTVSADVTNLRLTSTRKGQEFSLPCASLTVLAQACWAFLSKGDVFTTDVLARCATGGDIVAAAKRRRFNLDFAADLTGVYEDSTGRDITVSFDDARKPRYLNVGTEEYPKPLPWIAADGSSNIPAMVEAMREVTSGDAVKTTRQPKSATEIAVAANWE